MNIELPSNEMWCGNVIPLHKGQSIFEFFTQHYGEDIVKVRETAEWLFDLTRDEFNYWLGEWRFVRR